MKFLHHSNARKNTKKLKQYQFEIVAASIFNVSKTFDSLNQTNFEIKRKLRILK